MLLSKFLYKKNLVITKYFFVEKSIIVHECRFGHLTAAGSEMALIAHIFSKDDFSF